MIFSIEIEEKNIDEMAGRWLSKNAQIGRLQVLKLGEEKARETMQRILDCEKGSTPDLEKNAIYITQIYLATVTEPNLIWKMKPTVT